MMGHESETDATQLGVQGQGLALPLPLSPVGWGMSGLASDKDIKHWWSVVGWSSTSTVQGQGSVKALSQVTR